MTSSSGASSVALDNSAAQVNVALVPLRHGGFSCKALTLEGEHRLTARFEARENADWVEVTVVPKDERGAIFRRLDHCAVRYRGALAERTEERRNEVTRLILAVASSVDTLLANKPGMTLAAALGRGQSAKMVFGRDALRSLLSPEIIEGVPLVEGFSLCDVYPSSYLQKSLHEKLELVLDFRRDSDARRMLLVVKERDDSRPSFATTAHFSITHLALGASDPPGADAVRTLVAFVLQLRDHAGMQVVFPDVMADVAPLLLAPPESEMAPTDEILNLAIDAECGQSCAFCSIKETSPADDGGDATLARLLADLTSNRQRGVSKVRVNGYDPLAYSRILELLARMTVLGYTEAHVFSPCTRLAEAAFCDAVFAALPAKKRFHVPLYSQTAEIHDAIVGRKGAHALVMQAIANLQERLDPRDIWILCVATKEGLAELPSVVSFADARGFPCYPHMPYPSFESRADRYYRAVPRMSDVAEVIVKTHREGRRLAVQGVVPCTVFPRATAAGLPIRAWLDVPDKPPMLPGTEYRDERFRHRAEMTEHAAFHASAVPCPHKQRCVLASACPGEVLRSYAEAFGFDELVPVTLKQLISAT